MRARWQPWNNRKPGWLVAAAMFAALAALPTGCHIFFPLDHSKLDDGGGGAGATASGGGEAATSNHGAGGDAQGGTSAQGGAGPGGGSVQSGGGGGSGGSGGVCVDAMCGNEELCDADHLGLDDDCDGFVDDL